MCGTRQSLKARKIVETLDVSAFFMRMFIFQQSITVRRVISLNRTNFEVNTFLACLKLVFIRLIKELR